MRASRECQLQFIISLLHIVLDTLNCNIFEEQLSPCFKGVLTSTSVFFHFIHPKRAYRHVGVHNLLYVSGGGSGGQIVINGTWDACLETTLNLHFSTHVFDSIRYSFLCWLLPEV
jgi:hypothetical protein